MVIQVGILGYRLDGFVTEYLVVHQRYPLHGQVMPWPVRA